MWKIKFLAALLAVSLLCVVTSAQSYTIRVAFEHQFEGERQPPGQHYRNRPSWLNLDRRRQLQPLAAYRPQWQRSPGWRIGSAHQRVEEVVETGGRRKRRRTTTIDNCCFVDRQCATDQEWTDGYWAFQNGQCGESVQTQTQTSSQPVSVDTGQTDNCCFPRLGLHDR